jgi:hypothetical protein
MRGELAGCILPGDTIFQFLYKFVSIPLNIYKTVCSIINMPRGLSTVSSTSPYQEPAGPLLRVGAVDDADLQ